MEIPDELTAAVEIGEMIPHPLEAETWYRQALNGARVLRRDDLETLSGWPVVVFEGSAGGEPLIASFFKFFDYGAAVLFRGEPRSDQLLAAISSAEPDWSCGGLVVCLAELFADDLV